MINNFFVKAKDEQITPTRSKPREKVESRVRGSTMVFLEKQEREEKAKSDLKRHNFGT